MAETTYSARFESSTSSVPVAGRPHSVMAGAEMDQIIDTVATTQLDTAADFRGLIPVPAGAKIAMLLITATDADTHATPTLDADIILRTVSGGTTTDTILFNAGTAFQAAVTNKLVVLDDVKVPDDADGVGIIGLYVNTVAATAAAMTLELVVFWR